MRELGVARAGDHFRADLAELRNAVAECNARKGNHFVNFLSAFSHISVGQTKVKSS
jgi:hypothetical protein